MKRPTCPKCGKPGMHKASNGQRPRWRCETNDIVCYQTTDPSKPVRDQAGRPAIPQNVKVLVLDIETFPLESYTWGIWEQNVGLEQIKTEATIASFGAKWLGKKELIFAHTGGRGAAEVRDDRILMPPLWNIPTSDRLRVSLFTPARKIEPQADVASLPWVKITPLDAPAVPEVKLIAARSAWARGAIRNWSGLPAERLMRL